MNKKFNTTGVCVPDLHYMVDIKNKLNIIETMVHRGGYFVINRPRQYGKTTTMYMLEQTLKNEYLIISISFEGIGDSIFSTEAEFSTRFLKILARSVKLQDKEISDFIMELSKTADNFEALSYDITDIVDESDRPVILLIDEVDKNSNNQLFLGFLGLLRNKI
jgi:hypothetical protein